jgi:acyl-CoA thioester hydrolase
MPDSSEHRAAAVADFDRTDPGSYGYWARDILRWSDTDGLGHINNVEFARFFESGRISFVTACGRGLGVGADDFVLAHLSIDFRAQMHYPGEVRTGVRVLRVGRASVRFAEATFQDDRCTASGEVVVVMVDPETGRPTPIPDSLRAQLLDPAR